MDSEETHVGDKYQATVFPYMGTKGLTNIPERVAKTLIDEVDKLEESDIEHHLGDHRVDLTFYPSDFENYQEAKEVESELEQKFMEIYREGDRCPHDSLDGCVTTQTYQQSAGLSILDAGADLSGDEVIQVCAECGVVIKVIKEASMTGESSTF